MAKQKKREINNRSIGHLANELFNQKQRIHHLENTNGSDKNSIFGMNPLVAIGSVAAFLILAFGSAYKWQIDRIDKDNREDISRIKTEYESRINWLNEQHKKDNGFSKKQCKYELKLSNHRLNSCVTDKKELATKLERDISLKGSAVTSSL